MECPKCGTSYEKEQQLCNKCGRRITNNPLDLPKWLKRTIYIAFLVLLPFITIPATFIYYFAKNLRPNHSRSAKESAVILFPTALDSQAKVTKSEMHCPFCHSNQIARVDRRNDFCAGISLGGAILVGGIGIGTGLVGLNKSKIMCMQCGYTWML